MRWFLNEILSDANSSSIFVIVNMISMNDHLKRALMQI